MISAVVTAIAILPLLLPTADSPAAATWHVSPTGSDRANGTATAPFLTITRAVNTARSGDTVRVADGVYRESVQVYRKSLDIVGASQTGTVLDGTREVLNWTPAGPTWTTPWSTNFERPFEDIQMFENKRIAGSPEQFFLDGTALTEVATSAEVTPTSFYYDRAGSVVHIGADPYGRLVEGSVLQWGLHLDGADRSTVTGLTVRRYATSQRQLAAVRVHSAATTVRDVTVDSNSYVGISAIGAGIEFDRLSATRNGQIGVNAFRANDFQLVDSTITFNNTERFNWSWAAGGLKATNSSRLFIAGNFVVNNQGPGIWFDLDIEDSVIARNVVRDNRRSGLMIEVSNRNIAVDNIITGNDQAGVYVLESQDVEVWHNAVFDNWWDVRILEGPRRLIENVDVFNNILGGEVPSREAILYADNWEAKRSAKDFGLQFDDNRYWWPMSSSGRWISQFADWPAGLLLSTTIEQHGSRIAGQGGDDDLSRAAANPFVRDVARNDYRQPDGAPAGAMLPDDVAAVMGRSAGVRLPAGPTFVPGADVPPPRPTASSASAPPPPGSSSASAPTPPLPLPLPLALDAPDGVGLVPITPRRIVDTRSGLGAPARLRARTPVVVTTPASLDGSRVLSATVTAVNPAAPGWAVIYPCSAATPPPGTSTVNFVTGGATANTTIATTDPSGRFCLYSDVDTDVIVDVSARFDAVSTIGFTPNQPVRVADTRVDSGGPRMAAGETREVAVAAASAVALNVTVVDPDMAGFVTVFPCGTRPLTSTVNYTSRAVAANNVIVGADSNRVCVYASTATDVLVDVVGTFNDGTGLRLVPSSPTRQHDSREGAQQWDGVRVVDFPNRPERAEAIAGNLTSVADVDGYITAYDCGTRPPTSSINPIGGRAVANGAHIAIGAGRRSCFYSPQPSELIVDINGWWVRPAE